MKHKIFLSMLSLCVLCSDAAFGSRKGPAAPKPKTSAHTQALTGAQQYGLFDPLPDTDLHPEGKPILNVLQKSTDPQAGEAIGALVDYLQCWMLNSKLKLKMPLSPHGSENFFAKKQNQMLSMKSQKKDSNNSKRLSLKSLMKQKREMMN